MKATELRIGNLVYNWYNRNHIEWMLNIDDLTEIVKNNHHYKPIPLTEEWLLKFGFKVKDKNRLDWVKGAFNLERSNEDDSKFCFEVYSHYIPLDYVHQFQNLYFALTGEELQIKL